MTTDGSYRRSMFAGIIIGNLFQTGSQFGPVAVECHDVSQVSRQLVIDNHLTTTRLIQYRHLHPITELRYPVHQQDIHIFDKRIVPDFVIGNIILDILDTAVISYRHVMQRHVPQTGMLAYTSRQRKLRLKNAQFNFP